MNSTMTKHMFTNTHYICKSIRQFTIALVLCFACGLFVGQPMQCSEVVVFTWVVFNGSHELGKP